VNVELNDSNKLTRPLLDVGWVSRAVCGVTHQPVGQADTLQYGLKRRLASRSESVGYGINSMPNPPYIFGVDDFKYLWLGTGARDLPALLYREA
jgi:hypothetical protein